VHDKLSLGQLKGNRFSVALRFISNDITDEAINKNVKIAAETGFLNYFGM
jgi:tRNA(Glu) U13 pseudouridine synthase TruD